MPGRDEVYLEWLAAAPKGVRWDKAQEMYALYQEGRKAQADAVAKRLLGNRSKGIITAYELSRMANGQYEAVATYHFCESFCRSQWIHKNRFTTSVGCESDDNLLDGEVCEECGEPFQREYKI